MEEIKKKIEKGYELSRDEEALLLNSGDKDLISKYILRAHTLSNDGFSTLGEKHPDLMDLYLNYWKGRWKDIDL